MSTSIKATPLFKRLNERKPRKINLLRGGTRSSKTYSLCQLFAIWLMTGRFTKHTTIPRDSVYILRHTLPSLKRTVLKDFIDVLHTMGCYQLVHYNKTQIIFSYAGREVIFLEGQDPEKLKGISPAICWLNEGDGFQFNSFFQLNLRTRYYTFVDYNPSNPETYPKMLEDEWLPKRDDIQLDVSTYFDNPFLDETVINEIKELKGLDDELHAVYTKGAWAKLTGVILNYQTCIEMPKEGRELYGLDFGFNDPNACVRVKIVGNSLYVEELFYKNRMTMPEISAELIKHGVRRAFADSAAAQQIADLRSMGHRIKPALKGKDSIATGIKRLKQFHIFVTEDSVNLLKELNRYKWQQDINGNHIDKPVDAYNHAIDALRYSISRLNTKRFLI